MDIAYDLEFDESGGEIKLLSIGMVKETGEELYLVNGSSMLMRSVWSRNEFVRNNVLPMFPGHISSGGWRWDKGHPEASALHSLREISILVQRFVLGSSISGEVPAVNLWAWYGAYDHVCMCKQLFGMMSKLPEGFPMWTHELKQLCEDLGNPELPKLDGAREHHAIDDAREVMMRLKWLRNLQARQQIEHDQEIYARGIRCAEPI